MSGITGYYSHGDASGAPSEPRTPTQAPHHLRPGAWQAPGVTCRFINFERSKAPTPRRCPMVGGGRQRPSSDGDSGCRRPASDRAGQPETRPAAGPMPRRHSVARQRAARAARPSGLAEGKSRCQCPG